MTASRFRTDNQMRYLPQAWAESRRNSDNGLISTDAPLDFPQGYDGSWKETTDEVHPNYRKRVKRGEIIIGPFVMRKASRVVTNVDIKMTHSTFYRVIHGDYMSNVLACLSYPEILSISEADMASIADLAVAKAHAKVSGDAVMTGELVADLDKSVAMLRRPFSNSIKLIGKMNKSRLRNLGKTATSAAKAASNAWLEYRYGWKPILMDADSVFMEAHKQHELLFRRRLVARSGQTLNREFSYSKDVGGTGWVTSVTVNEAAKFSGSANAGVIYDVDPMTSTESLRQLASLRTRDIPSTAWELLPFSFVADWFFNVGTWIQAVTPVPNVSIRGSWVTKVHSIERKISADWTVLTWVPPIQKGHAGDFLYNYTEVERIPNPEVTTTPVPTVGSLSTLHCTDGLALACNNIIAGLRKLRH